MTWDAFSSSDTTEPFPRNTEFTIESSTGKWIFSYSQMSDVEDEVLFDKGSRFLVLSNEQVDGITQVVLRHVP